MTADAMTPADRLAEDAFTPVSETESSGSAVLLAQVSKLKQGELQKALIERGWSQSDMARALGVRPDVIGDLINMKRVPRLTEDQTKLILLWTGKLPEELVPKWLTIRWTRGGIGSAV